MKLAPSLPRGKLRPTGASVHEQCVRDRALTCPQIRPCLRLPARARVKSSTRHPSPHKSSGRKSNRRGVRTRRRCGSRRCRPKSRRRGPPAGILTWPGPGQLFTPQMGRLNYKKRKRSAPHGGSLWGDPCARERGAPQIFPRAEFALKSAAWGQRSAPERASLRAHCLSTRGLSTVGVGQSAGRCSLDACKWCAPAQRCARRVRLRRVRAK